MMCVVSKSLASGRVCVSCFNGQEAGKGRQPFWSKCQDATVKNKSEDSDFQSLTVNHFSALPGSFLSLLHAPERRMSLLGFQICSRTSLLLQQLYHRNRHPALRSYGNEMITYLLIFWDGSYFIKGNYSLPF